MTSQADSKVALFQNLQRFARGSDSHPKPNRVHHLRTTIRRVETLLSAGRAAPGRKEQRLLQQLRRIRRQAGKVRDIDVQLKALGSLRMESATRDRKRIEKFLKDLRAKYERKLQKAFREELEDGLRKRLKATAARLQDFARARHGARPGLRNSRLLSSALQRFAAVVRKYPTWTEDNLHAFRMDCKRVRYLAEMAEGVPQAEVVVNELKRIQDAAGDWHDWLTLTSTAEELLPSQSPLIAALRATTRSKYVQALQVAADATRILLETRASARNIGKPAGRSRQVAATRAASA